MLTIVRDFFTVYMVSIYRIDTMSVFCWCGRYFGWRGVGVAVLMQFSNGGMQLLAMLAIYKRKKIEKGIFHNVNSYNTYN